MGKCVSKEEGFLRRNKKKAETIPSSSPLGQMLDKWYTQEVTKGLDKIKMIYYFMEVWPKLDLQGAWPCVVVCSSVIIMMFY